MLDNMQTKNLGILYHKLNMIYLRRKLTEVERELAHNIANELQVRGYDAEDFTQELSEKQFEKFLKDFSKSAFSRVG